MAEYPVIGEAGPPPVFRCHTSPGTLERRKENKRARECDDVLPYREDDDERFRLL